MVLEIYQKSLNTSSFSKNLSNDTEYVYECNNSLEDINKIKNIINYLIQGKKQWFITREKFFKLINKCDILSLKKIKNISDVRANKILKHLRYNRINSVKDLERIFSKKVVESILKNVKWFLLYCIN